MFSPVSVKEFIKHTPILSLSAEPSVHLPSRQWYQQPCPQEVWECRLPSSGLPAWFPQSTQKGRPLHAMLI